MQTIDYLVIFMNTGLYAMFAYMGWRLWHTKVSEVMMHTLRITCFLGMAMLTYVFWDMSFQQFGAATAVIPLVLTLPVTVLYHKFVHPHMV